MANRWGNIGNSGWLYFWVVQFSHYSQTTGKIIALTRWTFVGKVMSLLFNMLSSLFPCYKWGNWGSERESDMPKVTQPRFDFKWSSQFCKAAWAEQAPRFLSQGVQCLPCRGTSSGGSDLGFHAWQNYHHSSCPLITLNCVDRSMVLKLLEP